MKHFNDYHTLARQILQLVGGPSNVISVNHCQTRLRFVLRNEALADTAALQQLGRCAHRGAPGRAVYGGGGAVRCLRCTPP